MRDSANRARRAHAIFWRARSVRGLHCHASARRRVTQSEFAVRSVRGFVIRNVGPHTPKPLYHPEG
eukprot:5871819-Lingulodinium_polyedra.AAC.1